MKLNELTWSAVPQNEGQKFSFQATAALTMQQAAILRDEMAQRFQEAGIVRPRGNHTTTPCTVGRVGKDNWRLQVSDISMDDFKALIPGLPEAAIKVSTLKPVAMSVG